MRTASFYLSLLFLYCNDEPSCFHGKFSLLMDSISKIIFGICTCISCVSVNQISAILFLVVLFFVLYFWLLGVIVCASGCSGGPSAQIKRKYSLCSTWSLPSAITFSHFGIGTAFLARTAGQLCLEDDKIENKCFYVFISSSHFYSFMVFHGLFWFLYSFLFSWCQHRSPLLFLEIFCNRWHIPCAPSRLCLFSTSSIHWDFENDCYHYSRISLIFFCLCNNISRVNLNNGK